MILLWRKGFKTWNAIYVLSIITLIVCVLSSGGCVTDAKSGDVYIARLFSRNNEPTVTSVVSEVLSGDWLGLLIGAGGFYTGNLRGRHVGWSEKDRADRAKKHRTV